jgi:hypothetical protein
LHTFQATLSSQNQLILTTFRIFSSTSHALLCPHIFEWTQLNT